MSVRVPFITIPSSSCLVGSFFLSFLSLKSKYIGIAYKICGLWFRLAEEQGEEGGKGGVKNLIVSA